MKRYNMLVTKYAKHDQNGMVSMLTVIILSILLSLITTAFVRVAVSEQRNATNDDLSNRAFYAAQAGFEDAMHTLATNPQNQSTCGSTQVISDKNQTGIDAAYTCKLVSLNVTDLMTNSIDVNKAYVYPLDLTTYSSPSYTLNVSWTSSGSATVNNKSLPPTSYWLGQNYYAAMRADLVWFPASGSLNNNSVKSQAYYFVPSTSNEAPTTTIGGSGGLPTEPILYSNCSGSSGTGSCTGTIKLGSFNSSNHVFLVLRPIYKSVAGSPGVDVNITESNGAKITFANGQASVDITGRAGDAYRRIKQNVPYGKYQVSALTTPDFSLIGGNGICKQTVVGSTSSVYNAGTPCS
jgi:Tfp pilus assembly protein PilX